MIPRLLEARLLESASRFPAVTLTGPRQSGKTTLARKVFHEKPYLSLESQDTRRHATADPRSFLSQFPSGAVLDEIQRAPELATYLQELIDDDPRPGRWILTGSENFTLTASVAQSLAGRTAMLTLLPLSWAEIQRSGAAPKDLFEALLLGSYPRVFDAELAPSEWYDSYLSTYVERDVRQLLNIGDLASFRTYFELCAGRSGQLLNLSSLGADAGVSHHTAKSWLSVLEASYLVHQLRPSHSNITKRLVKSPKLHFVDVGLLCFLLGIRDPAQLANHPLRGAIFETWVVSEVLKAWTHGGERPALTYFRDRSGAEIDLLVERGSSTIAVEVKSGRTLVPDLFAPLRRFESMLATDRTKHELVLVYGGAQDITENGIRALPWDRIHEVPWTPAPAWRPQGRSPRAAARKRPRA